MQNAIIDAVHFSEFERIKALLKGNPELVHVHTPDSRSLLSLAFNVETAKLLLENGIKVNHRSNKGCTALHRMGIYHDKELISLLLRYGANPYIRDVYSNSAETFCRWCWDGYMNKNKDKSRKHWEWIQSIPTLVTLMAINERRKVDGGTVLQTELFRYLQSFLTSPV